MNEKKRVIILGATGSIGENAIRVARALRDRVEVVGVAANSKVERLAELAHEFHCRYALVNDVSRYETLKTLVPAGCTPLAGSQAMCELAASGEADLILCAIVGTGGLLPCLEAARAHKTIALASKEVMVMAGHLFTTTAAACHAQILPVDSEHSAIFQCLQAGRHEDVERLLLTASGGPFRRTPTEEMRSITPEQALRHPTWNMGQKVTLDSATLMNKALEMIEARWLFDLPPEKIDVVIHPQSVIHSMVEYADGAVIAQMSMPDMAFPIQYSFTWPERVKSVLPRLDLTAIKGGLSFEEPDNSRFPSLGFAREAMRVGRTMPAVLNAANEVAVEKFRAGEIRFTDIWTVVERTMSAHSGLNDDRLDAILSADAWAREYARALNLPKP